MKIQEIKEQLKMSTVLAHYGLKQNRNKHIHCPFHDDKTPSMRVYEDTNTVYCFSGNCDTHGHSLDVIDFVMKIEQASKHNAILKCKDLLGFVAETKAKNSPQQEMWALLKKRLRQTPRAKDYLKARGLNHLEVGFNSGNWANKNTKDTFYGGLDKWGKNSVVFALNNARGQVVSFYARSLSAGHFYQSGRTGLFPCYPSKKATKIILTESIIDAHTLLHLDRLQEYEILALFGTNGLTKEHEKALANCQDLQEIYLMLDGDAAGQKASKKYQEHLSIILPGIAIKIVALPKDTDVNELWVNHLNQDLFLELLEQAKGEHKSSTSIKSKLDSKDKNNLIYKGDYATYFIKGFQAVKHMDSLKITLVTQGAYQKKYRGKVELYEDNAIQKYCKNAGLKLDIEASYLDLDISLLTDELEAYRDVQLKLKAKPLAAVKSFQLSAKNRLEALQFLKEKDLFSRLNKLIGKAGIVGEFKSRLLLLVIGSSYKCSNPLHALIQGSSGSGKTLLLRKIKAFLPKEDAFLFTRVSDKSLYHAGTKYKHKFMGIEDVDGLSEEVLYILRELQTGKSLSSSVAEKNSQGKIDSVKIEVQGPIASMMCTTQGAIYEDNMSRCFLVAVDESKKQTGRILQYQYQKDRGEIDKKAAKIATEQIQNLVYLLQPKEVINPFAGKLVLPPSVHKIRRLNDLFQTFVRQVAWWHQYQRKTDGQDRIIAQKEDLEIAIDLLFESIVLKVDELDGELRKFFEKLKKYVEQQEDNKYPFIRREIRDKLNVERTRLHRYLQDLLDLEYITLKGGHANKGYHYQILFWDDNQRLRRDIKDFLSQQLKDLNHY